MSTTTSQPISTRHSGSANHAYLALAIAIMAASFAAVFVRLTLDAGMPALLIAAGRLTLSSVVLTPIVLRRYRQELARLTATDLLFAVLAGLWIGVHFIFFVTSLEHTTVLTVQVITNTAPIWVGMLEVVFLKERLSRTIWAGIILTLIGGAVIGFVGADPQTTEGANMQLGSLLALGAAITSAVYITIGRKVRAKVSMVPYVWIVFGCGALTVLPALLITSTPLGGYPVEAYFWLIMVTLIPQLIGHSGFNYAVGYISATIVSLATQIITVTAGIIAFLLFAEVPDAYQIMGSLIIMIGVGMAIISRQQQSRAEAQP